MGSLQASRSQALSAAMRRAEEGLRAATVGGTGSGSRGTPLHLHNPLLRNQPPQQPPPAPAGPEGSSSLTYNHLHGRKDTSITDSRRGLFEDRVVAWDKEMDNLEASITKQSEQPTMSGARSAWRERP